MVLFEVFMAKKILPAVLIVLTLLTGIAVPVPARQTDGQAAGEEKPTREEEREALRIAEQFLKSFEERQDTLLMMDELYVRDFAARLRKDLNSFIYLVKVEPEVTAEATDTELRRLYAVSLNFIYASTFLIHAYNTKLNGEEAENNDAPLNKLLPPEVIAVLKSDPIMAELIAEDEVEERERNPAPPAEPEQRADRDTEEDRANGPEIRSLERLRGFVSTLEKATVLIREHLKTVQGPHTWKELMIAAGMPEGGDVRPDGCKGMCPRVNTLSKEFFGSPAGTRLICLSVLPFHIDLVKVDGRLRILNVYLMDD
jgi:hypothetical protein